MDKPHSHPTALAEGLDVNGDQNEGYYEQASFV